MSGSTERCHVNGENCLNPVRTPCTLSRENRLVLAPASEPVRHRAYSAELLPLLRRAGHRSTASPRPTPSDFVWKKRRAPLRPDGVSAGQRRVPRLHVGLPLPLSGLVVLHDAQLHQARALRSPTMAAAPRRLPRRVLAPIIPTRPRIGELVAAGLGGRCISTGRSFAWSSKRARLTVVHNPRLLEDLRRAISARESRGASRWGWPIRSAGRQRRESAHPSAPRMACRPMPWSLAAFGGITPEKRIPRCCARSARSRRSSSEAALHARR